MTRITWAKRLLGAALAVPMTMAGMALGVTTAVAADTVPTDHLVAQYDFTTKPADGKTVANSAPNAALGAATVQNASDGLWSGESLTLSGGAKDGSGDWVKLPENILAKATSATVTMEVKADATMLGNFHFMWNIGNNSSDTEYFFTSLNCGSGRNPLVGIKANGAEQLVQSESCAVTADRWMSVTARISNGQARLYIDGRRVA
ncbi:MAG TPA: glycosyl hydrolase family 43, partial [Bifidobacterium sp.]|nr:glycosyl hydrolase family 43 [Bifidobacterium sp.]